MTDKQTIIDQFSQYLHTLPGDAQTIDGPATDLMALFEALSVLKNEVKTESRQVKTALDEFKSVFTSMDAQQQVLQQTLDDKQRQLDAQSSQLLKPMLLSMIAFHDRLSIAISAIVEPKPRGWRARFTLPLWQKLQTIKQGQEITLRQLQRTLEEHQVSAIDTQNQPYDPKLMKVVDIQTDPSLADNVVTAQTLTGFLWQGRLLRAAEVKVNKQETTA